MKIIDDYFPDTDSEDIALTEMTIRYTQNLDCCQDKEEYPDECQTLTITTDAGGGGKFFRISTGKSGWSVSDLSDFELVFNNFKNRMKFE